MNHFRNLVKYYSMKFSIIKERRLFILPIGMRKKLKYYTVTYATPRDLWWKHNNFIKK